MQDERIIEVTGLTKRFKSITAVDKLNFNVFRGDVFGFLGPNGAGKSTTIRMLVSLIFPNEGSIKIFGKSINEHRLYILRKIGAIVEKPDFYKYMSAQKNLEILGSAYGCDVSGKRIMEILDLVGLVERAKSKVKTYSHGMKQRLGIAQALLHNPKLIILDEPTTGLDPQGMKDIRNLITNLSREQNKTVFLSSHILHEVEQVANRMIIINKGKTIVEGSVEDLLKAAGMEVAFSINNIESAGEILGSRGFADKVKSKNGNNIVLSLNEAEVPIVNKIFVDSGIDVHSIIPSRSLEEYFLSLTEKG